MNTGNPISPELQAKIDALDDDKLKKDITFLLSGPGIRAATNEEIFEHKVSSYMKSKAERARWRQWRDDEVMSFIEYFKTESPDDHAEYIRQDRKNNEIDADLSWRVETLAKKWISGLPTIDYILLLSKMRDHVQAQLRSDEDDQRSTTDTPRCS